MEREDVLEECLDRYPQFREELEPLLEVAVRISAARRDVRPSPLFLIELKKQLNQTETKGGDPYRGAE
ncbi:MAG: hypothetical protein HYS09_05185 [Chloroflexi bacterium]|nr:hypothetical protein [Chloroflexota bacterium]